MTTPTQAQIEAATLLNQIEQHLMQKHRSEAEWVLTHALTAAAQVREQRNLTPQEQDVMQKALRASSEPVAAAQVRKPPLTLKYTDKDLHFEVNNTIERCAQYHDKAAKDCDELAAINPHLAAGYNTRAMDHRIDAANIRKLKDAPNS